MVERVCVGGVMQKAIVVGVLVIGFAYFMVSSFFGAAAGCSMFEEQVRTSIAQSASCNSDSDCTLMQLPCPFDCLTPMNSSGKTAVTEALDTYTKSCMNVCPDCPKNARAKVSCVASRCQIVSRAL